MAVPALSALFSRERLLTISLPIALLLAWVATGTADFAEEKRQEQSLCSPAAAPTWCSEADQ